MNIATTTTTGVPDAAGACIHQRLTGHEGSSALRIDVRAVEPPELEDWLQPAARRLILRG
jgi:hypothetical protein